MFPFQVLTTDVIMFDSTSLSVVHGLYNYPPFPSRSAVLHIQWHLPPKLSTSKCWLLLLSSITEIIAEHGSPLKSIFVHGQCWTGDVCSLEMVSDIKIHSKVRFSGLWVDFGLLLLKKTNAWVVCASASVHYEQSFRVLLILKPKIMPEINV